MMGKNNSYPRGYRSNAFETVGESEGFGCSGRVDAEITASEDSSAPARKCISLNSNSHDMFSVPTQVLPLSNLSQSERKNLIRRLRTELEQIRKFQKKVEYQRAPGAAVSSSSDILSCSNGQNGQQPSNFQKTKKLASLPGKKLNPSGKDNGHARNHGASGRFEAAVQPSAASNIIASLMKQCEALLKRLMSHQYAWVFSSPVDVVKLNIPDYFDVIKHPMDLGTVKKKLASGAYPSPLDFAADVRLTFDNATTYNPSENTVHTLAKTLSKFFEVRWQAIEKKLPKTDAHPPAAISGPSDDHGTAKPMLPSKKRKASSIPQEAESAKRLMTVEEKHNLGRELESLLGELPLHIIEFLKEHSSEGKECEEDEIEIDIDDLSDDTLFKLRKLLDDYSLDKQKRSARSEISEMELLNSSGVCNSSMQPCKESNPVDEDVDIGGIEPPISSWPHLETEREAVQINNERIGLTSSSGSGSSSHIEAVGGTPSSPVKMATVPQTYASKTEFEETVLDDPSERNESISGLDRVERPFQHNPSSVESDCCQDDGSAPTERQLSPEKRYRAAVLKGRFADTILRAKEKTLMQGDKGDPEKLRREREKLELEQRRERARLQAEAKAAEDAQKRAEAEAAAEARRKRELEREAARQALLQMEKTVEINENSQFLQDLELLRTAPAEQLPSSVDETSPDHSQDGMMGGFKFGGSNPLAKLGLFIKEDEEEEECEPPCLDNPVKEDVEDGEID